MSTSTQLTINTGEYTVSRISKAGKQSYRGLLGVIASGNKAERTQTVDRLVYGLWTTGTFRPLMAELRRVFNAKQFETGAGFCGLDFMAPKKAPMLNYIRGIASAFDGKEVKGEKAMFIQAIRNIIVLEEIREIESAIQESHEEAAV